MQIWKAHYKDEFHDTDIEILNDGDEISFTLDGFRFSSSTNISEFEYINKEKSSEVENRFNIIKMHGKYATYYALQRYALDVEIPVKVIRKTDTAEITGVINISFQFVEHDINKPQVIFMNDGKRVYYDDTIVNDFSLCVDGKRYSSEKNTLDFEIALSDICTKIKSDYYIKSCFTCQYSEYSPYGHDGFGCMLCYREHKENYLKVNNFFKYLINEDSTFRQETFLCSDYDLRNKCGGYRGFVDI